MASFNKSRIKRQCF